jgi:hypothetical protein
LGIQYDTNKTEKYAAQNTYFTRKMREGTRYYKDGAYRYFLPDGAVNKTGIMISSNTTGSYRDLQHENQFST